MEGVGEGSRDDGTGWVDVGVGCPEDPGSSGEYPIRTTVEVHLERDSCAGTDTDD